MTSFAGALLAMLALLPLIWKWKLGMRRGLFGLAAVAVLGGAAALAVGTILRMPMATRGLLGGLFTLAGACLALVLLFYRDPERTPPIGDRLVLSPADGEIVYVKRSRNGRLPISCKHGTSVLLEELTHAKVHDGEAIVVGVGMSLLDVHVNRAPIAGQVVLRRHFPGRFGSLRRASMVFQNERVTTVIRGHSLEVALVQIASRLVRQIAGYVSEGDQVGAGQRIGAIRFGSQVDLVLPSRPDLQLAVRQGDRVKAGVSIVAAVTRAASEFPPPSQAANGATSHLVSESAGSGQLGKPAPA